MGFDNEVSNLMLGRHGKQQNGLIRTVLALFIFSCLSVTFQSGLMAATPNDCHESSKSSSTTVSLSEHTGSMGSDCTHCTYNEPAVSEQDSASLYICALMSACSIADQQSAISTSELNLKSWVISTAPSWQNIAKPSADSFHPQFAIGVPASSLNIHYCRFLI